MSRQNYKDTAFVRFQCNKTELKKSHFNIGHDCIFESISLILVQIKVTTGVLERQQQDNPPPKGMEEFAGGSRRRLLTPYPS